MYTQTHTTLGGTLKPSHLSADNSTSAVNPYIKAMCALLLPAGSDEPQSKESELGLLHAAVHISL